MMQTELRESEEKFRNLAEYSPNMIFIYKNGSVIYANTRCEEVMEYSREEFYAPDFDFMTLIDPESEEQVRSSLQKHMNGDEVAPYECKLITKQGEPIKAIITTKLIQSYGEQAILGVITDITEHKRLLETLKKSESTYRTLVEVAPDGIVTLNIEGVITSINPAFTRMTGYSEDEVIDTLFTELVCTSNTLQVLEMFGAFLFEEVDARLEFRFRHKDGLHRWGEAHVSAVTGAENGMSLLLILRDVTERKEMEAALQASEAKYMSVVENTRDGIVILQDGVVKFVNAASENLVHFRPDELRGRNFLSLVAPEHQTVVMQRYSERMRGKQVPPIYQIALLTKTGTMLPVEVNATIIEYEGRPADLVFIRDLTERKT